MVCLLCVYPLLLAAAEALAPPVVIPPAAPPARPPRLAVPSAASQVSRVQSIAPVASSIGQKTPHLRGQLPAVQSDLGWDQAEVKLLRALRSASPTAAAMYREASVLRLPKAANGEPSVGTLLDVLESKPLPAVFDKNALVGDWRLEYTNELPTAVREEVSRHVDHRMIDDLSVLMSISDSGTMDTRVVIKLRGGEEKVVNLHQVIAQIDSLPALSVDDQGTVEITYMSDGLLVMSTAADRIEQSIESLGFFRESPRKTDVWKKIEQASSETPTITGPVSLWRFGLPFDLVRRVQPDADVPQSVLASASPPHSWKMTVEALLFSALVAAVVGTSRWRTRAKEDAAATEMTSLEVLSSYQPRLAMAALASEPRQPWHGQRLSAIVNGGASGGAGALASGGTAAPAKAWWAGARKSARAIRMARHALGSIDQFKVFGPEGDKFEIETDKVIGVGGQGTVYLGHRQSDPATKYAIKTIPIWRLLMDPSAESKIREIRKETEVLSRIQGHPNVCSCIGSYDAFRPGTKEAQYIMIVMELIHGGELAQAVIGKPIAEDVARNILKQTADGLKFIHDNKVVHRDLKPENVLVCGDPLTTSTQIKLIDFGVAKVIDQSIAKTCVGTTEIMAPELVSAKLMKVPQGEAHKSHGPFTFKSPQQESPGFGIVTQRPDGKGAMVDGIETGGQAEKYNIGDGWAIEKINGVEILEMDFVKDFNAVGAGTKAGVKAICEILGSLDGDFTLEFVELPKREFTTKVDMWSLGCMLYVMLTGVKPFSDEDAIINGTYDQSRIAGCSPEAQDLVKRLLMLDPDQRLSMEQVLSHPWLSK